MQLAMIQDQIIPIENLDAPYLDRGIYFGDGVYEVIRSYNGKIFALEEHLQRLSSSLKAVEIKGISIDQVRSRVQKAFQAAAIANAKIYFHITRGSGPRTHEWDENLKPNFFLTITELHDDPETKTKGIAVSTHPDWRWKRCDIKSLNLLPNVLARQDAAKKGCQEAIFVDDKGLITEGAASAFFAVLRLGGQVGKALQTAPLTSNILPSVTRKFVLKAAKDIGLQIIEQPLTPKEAASADELFIAVTTKDIVPVVKFDSQPIADATPGKFTNLLIQKFRSFTL